MEVVHRSLRRILVLAVLALAAGLGLAVVWGLVRSGGFAHNFRTASIILGVLLIVLGGTFLGGMQQTRGGNWMRMSQRDPGQEPGWVNAIGLAAAGLLLIVLGSSI
jgi:hypothetical protein